MSLGNPPGNAAWVPGISSCPPTLPWGPRSETSPQPCATISLLISPSGAVSGSLGWTPMGRTFLRGAQTRCAGVPAASRAAELSPASPLSSGAVGASSQGLPCSLLALCLPWDVSWAHGAPPAPVPCLTRLLGCERALCLRLGTAGRGSRQPGRVAAAWAAPSAPRGELCGAPLSWSFLFSRHNYPPPSNYRAQQQPGGCGLLVCEL